MHAEAAEFFALVRQATPDSMEQAARLLPLCAGSLNPRQLRLAARLLEQAASSFRHALEALAPPAAYDARGRNRAEPRRPRLAMEA